jgi:hypothetical protein
VSVSRAAPKDNRPASIAAPAKVIKFTNIKVE